MSTGHHFNIHLYFTLTETKAYIAKITDLEKRVIILPKVDTHLH